MDIIPTNRTEIVVSNGRYSGPEPLKGNGIYLKQNNPEATMDNINGSQKTDFLIDNIIKTHHDFAKKKSVTIYSLAQKVFYRHSNTHPEILTINNIIFLFLHDLLNQMKEEEQFLFPRIRQAATDIKCAKKNDKNILQSLMQERKLLQNNHEKAFTYLNALRQATDNFEMPSDCSNSYKALIEEIKQLEDDLILHFHLEDDLDKLNG